MIFVRPELIRDDEVGGANVVSGTSLRAIFNQSGCGAGANGNVKTRAVACGTNFAMSFAAARELTMTARASVSSRSKCRSLARRVSAVKFSGKYLC